MTPSTLRDRTRRAVQGELVEVAQALFVERGYEATTVDAIVEAAGMSRRTFFRYFGSKEEVVLAKYDLLGQRLVEALEERPAGEALWTSLRRMFDGVIATTADLTRTPALIEMERIVTSTPALHAAYLERMDGVQLRVTAVIRARAEVAGTPWADDDPIPRAVVSAAFGCFSAARQGFLAAGRPLAGEVDRAMAALRGPAA